MKIGRIITTYYCRKDCELCCNKNWKGIPAVGVKEDEFDYNEYDMILITGGEPNLFPNKIINLCKKIKEKNKNITIILYTAYLKKTVATLYLIQNYLDGITVTLHDEEDIKPFLRFNKLLSKGWVLSNIKRSFSFRLNVFKGVCLPTDADISIWKVKSGIEWIKDCPLPKDEVLLKLEKLWTI